MVYKGCMIWKTGSMPYFFQNVVSFYPLFPPKKYTSLVYFLPYYPKDLEASFFFIILIELSPIFSKIQLVVPYRLSLIYHTECTDNTECSSENILEPVPVVEFPVRVRFGGEHRVDVGIVVVHLQT